MMILEALIFFIGIGSMYYQQKRTADLMNDILHNPEIAGAVASNMLFTTMQSITEDEEKAQVFFSFLQKCGVNTVAGIKYWMEQQGGVEGIAQKQATKGLPKEVKKVAKVLDFLGIDAKDIIKKGASKQVDTALEGW